MEINTIKTLKDARVLHGETVLDVGSRDCTLAKQFVENGFSVTAIDPHDFSQECDVPGITLYQTTFENFEDNRKFDIVVARLVSHVLKKKPSENILHLMGYAKENGILYFTVFGPEDVWYEGERKEEIDHVIQQAGHTVLAFHELRDTGKTYAGEEKDWHILVYIIQK